MENIKYIEEWYKSKCDGNWEHNYGIKIYTLDNPGWAVKIDLMDTDLEEIDFESVKKEYSNKSWIDCKIKDNIFIGYGGVDNLNEILSIFYNKILLNK